MKFGIFYELQLPRPWGAGRRAPALSERARPGGAGRPARLRLRLGGRAPFPRGILPLACPRGVPRRGQPAHQEDPARPRHRAAHHQPAAARRRAHRRARPGVATAASRWAPASAPASPNSDGFDRDMETKREVWEDALRCIIPMFKDQGVELDTKWHKMPMRNVLPKPVQKPHPPLWVACSQLETIEMAGRRGLGALGFQFLSRRCRACLGARLLQRLRQAAGEAGRLPDQPEHRAGQLLHVRRDRRGGAPPRRRRDVLPVRAALLRIELRTASGRIPARSTCGTNTTSGSARTPRRRRARCPAG